MIERLGLQTSRSCLLDRVHKSSLKFIASLEEFLFYLHLFVGIGLWTTFGEEFRAILREFGNGVKIGISCRTFVTFLLYFFPPYFCFFRKLSKSIK